MTKIKMIEAKVPEYNMKSKPDYIKVGKKVDKVIEKNFSEGNYVYRAIGKEDHPNLSLGELILIIKKLGTDKYDTKRKEVCHEEFSMYDYNFQAGEFKIKNHKIVLDESYEYPSLFGDTIKKFYENVLLDREYRIRIDILIIYDAKKLKKAKKIDPNAGRVRPELERCLYKFKNPKNKKGALVGIIKILR